jgi:hypothetical protein
MVTIQMDRELPIVMVPSDQRKTDPTGHPPEAVLSIRLPILGSPFSPFRFVETIVDARCYPGVK